MLSEPVLPGTIQVNHAGLPMILGVGAQTIGGYPRIGMVIRADKDAMGQLRPGDSVRFLPVNDQEAHLAQEIEHTKRSQWIDRLRGWSPPIG
jgi:allophanate hydrolase subunit 2